VPVFKQLNELLLQQTPNALFFSLLSCIYGSSPHRGMEMTTLLDRQLSWGRSVHLSSWAYLHYPLPQAH